MAEDTEGPGRTPTSFGRFGSGNEVILCIYRVVLATLLGVGNGLTNCQRHWYSRNQGKEVLLHSPIEL